ncbi:hypothetical protein FSP39_017204 [Pinctada imbricata]|uniref:Uncharacterized protein n=1 Tax=Pinctada imbricata TaxID=66713 RepID=A0AA89C1M9_PINIB|nr:hypothetical protein FSP39_017204 [Pinctada imbricata]
MITTTVHYLLQIMLNNQKHAYVLERACVQYEPDDERYIELTSKVYEHVNRTQQFDLLRSTRHFGPMAFYLTWHDKIDLLLADMLERNLLLDAEDLVKLYCIVHGKTVPNVQKLDLIKDYLTNHSHKDTMPHLELSIQSYEDKNKDGEPVINIENRQLLQKVINAGGL